MTDEELAREWLHRDQMAADLAVLLSRVRLEGAKAARAAMTSAPGGYSIFPVDELIEALEQAAGGSTAGSEK